MAQASARVCDAFDIALNGAAGASHRSGLATSLSVYGRSLMSGVRFRAGPAHVDITLRV